MCQDLTQVQVQVQVQVQEQVQEQVQVQVQVRAGYSKRFGGWNRSFTLLQLVLQLVPNGFWNDRLVN